MSEAAQVNPLRVAIVGCGLVGRKRADALGADVLVGCHDVEPAVAKGLADTHGIEPCSSLDEILASAPDVVIVATFHNQLADIACRALESGAHVLVEKPAGIGTDELDSIAYAAASADRLVKVGFNHRFHPAVARAVAEARSGEHGEILFVRSRYGHGGRLGYEREWRADPKRSGGGELVDQGMHLLDLSYWLLGELPLQFALMRTHFWQAPVEDNALLVLGPAGNVGDNDPWASLHVSWTEWKNLFSLEIACRHAKLAVEGLGGSYGEERLAIYRMRPRLGVPDIEDVRYAARDVSWEREWQHFATAIRERSSAGLLGDLGSARYAWECIEAARRR